MEVKGVPQEMAMLSNLLAAYTFIAGMPEESCVNDLCLAVNHCCVQKLEPTAEFIYQCVWCHVY